MDVFLRDIENESLISWDFLIADIKNTQFYNPYCKSANYYVIFKNIILSLLLDEEIILLDSDFTDSELINLNVHADYANFSKPTDKRKFSFIGNKNELIENLSFLPKKWKITMFTSGTTGVPKKVSHDFKSITRFVKVKEHHKKCVWGFAYNPTHMAGIQVFFQALLNGSSIIRLFNLNQSLIYDEIAENQITHISATPTFYKLLLPCDKIFHSIERVTSGGEMFVEKTIKQLNEVFPNAKTTNVYALTEAGTIFASKNDIFSILPEYDDLIRIEDNEIVIHTSLIGSRGVPIIEWYYTGDLIEIVSQKPLKFRILNRKSDVINIGGYKVNPHEVEDAILTIPGVKNVWVYCKKNSVLGNILCCEVVALSDKLSEAIIRTTLQSKIQEFKIPRIVLFVDELSTTRTGKLRRNNV